MLLKKNLNFNKKLKDSGVNETNKVGICSFGSGLSQPSQGKTLTKKPINMIHEITNSNKVHRLAQQTINYYSFQF